MSDETPKQPEKKGWFRRIFARSEERPEDEPPSPDDRRAESPPAVEQQPEPSPPPAPPAPPPPPELPSPPPEKPEPHLSEPAVAEPAPPPEAPQPVADGVPAPEPAPQPAGATPATRTTAEAAWIERRAQEVRARLAEEEAAQKVGWLGRLRRGLGRSSAKLAGGIGDLFVKRKLDDEALEELEELLITGDLGVETAARLTKALADARFGDEVSADEVRAALAEEVAKVLAPVAQTIAINDAYRPHVVLVCGVNGSGKTTTIAKLAHLFRSVGFEVMLAAGDTFRAAAIEQLQIWGERTGCPVIARPQGTDAASLAFEAYEQAKAAGAHVLLIDTAGRLQNKAHLMSELQKICRVLKKLDERAPHDCLLVLDASVGQNAHNQVEVFRDMVNVTGLAVTKLDGSAKGGVVVALAERFKLPVYAIGVGEGMDDMRAFEARAYARSLLGLDG
ncbi:MAG TPA: signal recognition particle-docking protein FtsY [Rhodospirillales bacterium]|nr:signal recognition particle-docking protein FtsY [Rhodospirillales bacterium]